MDREDIFDIGFWMGIFGAIFILVGFVVGKLVRLTICPL